MSVDLPPVAVVSADNRFLHWADRKVVHRDRLFHRSIHVLVFDAAGKLVIQKRHREKLTFASYWDLSCSGHVEQPDYPGGPDEEVDRVYRDVARRELGEELGIEAELTFVGSFGPSEPLHYEWIHLFRATHDGPYTLQAEEVEEVARVTPAELEAMAASGAKITGTLAHFAALAQREGFWG